MPFRPAHSISKLRMCSGARGRKKKQCENRPYSDFKLTMGRFVLPEDLIVSGRNLNPIHTNDMRVNHKPENVHNVALKS